MSLWQKAMITLARNSTITNFMHHNAATSRLAKSFVGGKTATDAVSTAKSLKLQNRDISAFYLGEYVDSEEAVAEGMAQLENVISALAAGGLQLHVSVDPTQIGSMQSIELLHANAEKLCQGLQNADSPFRKVLMIDMEDSSVTGLTLELYEAMRAMGYPVAITLQAYLHRSAADLKAMVGHGAMVRLVKGAFAEPASLAATSKQDIDQRYMQAIETMFSPKAKETGFYPVVASHDKKMVDYTNAQAEKNGWKRDEYEFEMLYGVREGLQRELAGQGYRMRAYLPFGESWFPYAIRRVGENPANTLFVLRAMVGG